MRFVVDFSPRVGLALFRCEVEVDICGLRFRFAVKVSLAPATIRQPLRGINATVCPLGRRDG